MQRGRFRTALAATLTSLVLTGTAYAGKPPLDDCTYEEWCAQDPPADDPPSEDPNDPPADDPTPASGPRTSLVGAFDMNWYQSNQQIYTVGFASCPNGYHPDWCTDPMQDGNIRYGGYHKLMTTGGPNENGEAFITLVKSPEGLGERFRFDRDALRIELELMDWTHNSWYRVLKDEQGRPGLMWLRLNLPEGVYAIDTGDLDYYRCDPGQAAGTPGALFEQHHVWAMNRRHGPYDISTPEGLQRARDALVLLRTQHNPAGVPDAWTTFPAQLGRPDAHAFLYVIEGMWGPINGHPTTSERDWNNKEIYAYIETVAPDNAWRRGVGLVMWAAFDEPDHPFSGNWAMYRQHIQTTVVQDGRTQMLELCEDPTLQGIESMSKGISVSGGMYRSEPFLIPEGIDGPWLPDARWKRRPAWMQP